MRDLTPTISATVRGLAVGAVLEIVTDDPEAEEGLRSWARLTGNELGCGRGRPRLSAHVLDSSDAARRGQPAREGDHLMATIIVNATHGPEDPERATLAFITGNVAATADQDAIVLLTIEGAWLGVRGRAEVVGYPGMPALRDVMAQFVAAGGRIWACGACTKPRGITQEDLVEGRHHRDRRPGRRASCFGRGSAYLLSLMVRTSGLIGREHEVSGAAAPSSPRRGGGAVASRSSLVKPGSGRPPSSSTRSTVASRSCFAGRRERLRRCPVRPARRGDPIASSMAGGRRETCSWPPERAERQLDAIRSLFRRTGAIASLAGQRRVSDSERTTLATRRRPATRFAG